MALIANSKISNSIPANTYYQQARNDASQFTWTENNYVDGTQFTTTGSAYGASVLIGVHGKSTMSMTGGGGMDRGVSAAGIDSDGNITALSPTSGSTYDISSYEIVYLMGLGASGITSGFTITIS